MSDLANLPADIRPTDFFKLIEEALASEPAPEGASPEKLQIHMSGDGGGAWTIGFEAGKLAATAEAVTGAPLQLSLSVPHFQAFVAGKIRDAVATKVEVGFDAKQVAKLYQVTNKTEQLKAFSGDLQLRIEDTDETVALTLTFGGATPDPANPKTTVSINIADFVALAGGELNPQQAFFTGKIRLDGDMNLAMSLMALV